MIVLVIGVVGCGKTKNEKIADTIINKMNVRDNPELDFRSAVSDDIISIDITITTLDAETMKLAIDTSNEQDLVEIEDGIGFDLGLFSRDWHHKAKCDVYINFYTGENFDMLLISAYNGKVTYSIFKERLEKIKGE